MSYRDMEEWLLASDQVCHALDLARVPDHSTLAGTFEKLKRLKLDHLQALLLEQLQADEEVIAVDSTGFTVLATVVIRNDYSRNRQACYTG